MEHHEINIGAPIEQVYRAVRTPDMSASFIIRWLFRLRGLPTDALTLDGLQELGFVLLGERSDQEILFGLVGQFWKWKGGLQPVHADGFCAFQTPGYAKAAWNFTLDPLPNGSVRVATETRVACCDGKSRKRFLRYWGLIGPFSAWTRREVLRVIKHTAEGSRQNISYFFVMPSLIGMVKLKMITSARWQSGVLLRHRQWARCCLHLDKSPTLW